MGKLVWTALRVKADTKLLVGGGGKFENVRAKGVDHLVPPRLSILGRLP